jgi:ubiquinone/menaquinone biosynthesis C-methylase UbiE
VTTPPKPYREYIESNLDEYRAYQRKALATEPEMTKLLKRLLAERLDTTPAYRVLDIGCGNGNTMFHLASAFPHWRYTGFDIVPGLIEDGKRLFANLPNLELFVADAHTIEIAEPYDIVLIWRVLQGLEDWQRSVEAAYRATRKGGHLIISTLLNDADVDVAFVMHDYQAEGDVKEAPLRLFSLARLRAFCEGLGVRSFHVEPFDMPIDLPRPAKGLNTYTVPLEDGHRLQLAGGLLVDHWKIVHMEV